MTELEIIERLRLQTSAKGLVLGIGDDCAIYRSPGASEDLLFTTDQLIEGTHFLPNTPPRRIAWKAIARALSDIAAMGGTPKFCLLSLAAPARFDFDTFYSAVRRVSERYKMTLAGGDLAKSKQVACDVVICGSTPRGSALRRDTAQPGDELYVSRPLGMAAACGYRNLPEPRLSEGRKLRGRATACMDLSDGLGIDLYRMCLASRTGASLDSVPVAADASLEQALHGGEDYELLYTGRDLPGIRIGTMTEGPAGVITLNGNPLPHKGWDHFAYNSQR
jgi:thiamine-monophosphate kinase